MNLALRFSDLGDETPFLSIEVYCLDCGVTLSRRTYDASTDDWRRAVKSDAIMDGTRGVAHHCGERN
jgi:hypothetical protein